ncbi:LacI family DNA-binding transcriptional regulator [uncultured Catenibacterium sp.]|uniref:LacI family DNA-binding transcriptional regulator n=1 Tax=uncultured Catenibacterium sp. TaxID=286142 RepID=UPI0025FA9496|nr:LacI family DNA-binding transcriptional regulator [uncultured Catenibacterium sp.]
MSITITQIAKLAGVSRGTVDRVIHKRGRVAPEVEKKILKIMEENDYHPNMLGRALAASKSPLIIGMVMIERGNPFFHLIDAGMKEAMAQFRDYPIELDFRHINGVDEEEYLKVLDELEHSVNALIISGIQSSRIIEKVNHIAKHIPVMTLNIDLEESNRIGFIGIDDYKAGTCLAGLTHDITRPGEDVLILSGSETIHSQSQRVKGFLDTMKHYPDIHLSDVIYTQDEQDQSDALLRQALNKKYYKTIVMIDSWLANAGEVVSHYDYHDINILGFDLMSQNKEALKQGKVTYIIDQSAYMQSYECVHKVCEYLIYGTKLPEGMNYLPIHIYNKYNLD